MSTLTRETLDAALEEAARIRDGFVPGSAELTNAPLLSHRTVEALPGGMIYLAGEVTGHPKIADGWCTTSVVLTIDIRAGWSGPSVDIIGWGRNSQNPCGDGGIGRTRCRDAKTFEKPYTALSMVLNHTKPYYGPQPHEGDEHEC